MSPPLPSCRPEGQELTTVPRLCPWASCWHFPSHVARTGPHTHPCPGSVSRTLAFTPQGAPQAGSSPTSRPGSAPPGAVWARVPLCSVASPCVCSPVTQHMKALLERNTKKKSKLRKKPKPYVEEPDGRASPAARALRCTALLSGSAAWPPLSNHFRAGARGH